MNENLVIQIKHGSGVPTSKQLSEYELGYSTDTKRVYVGQKDEDPVGMVGQIGSDSNTSEIFNDYEKNQANGNYSHAEGKETKASGQYSHAEGYQTQALGTASCAGGFRGNALGSGSHVQGYSHNQLDVNDTSKVKINNNNKYQLTDTELQRWKNNRTDTQEDGTGYASLYSAAIGDGAHAEGYSTLSIGRGAHSEGNYTIAEGMAGHAEGSRTEAYGRMSHAEGIGGKATEEASHAEGVNGEATGYAAHVEGGNCSASGYCAHAEGSSTVASGRYSHAEGEGEGDENSGASGQGSHAEGQITTAEGNYSHAEGSKTKAFGPYSHAEGHLTEAHGDASHAEGDWIKSDAVNTTDTTAAAPKAYGRASHAEGTATVTGKEGSSTKGYAAHAEGSLSVAKAHVSHAEGIGTIAAGKAQHVQGRYNIEDASTDDKKYSKYAHIVGNGSSTKRSNAHTLDWEGNGWYKGNVYVGTLNSNGTYKDANRLIKKSELDSLIPYSVHNPITKENETSFEEDFGFELAFVVVIAKRTINGANRISSGIWTPGHSGCADNMYGLYQTADYRTKVEFLSNTKVKITNETGADINYTVIGFKKFT